MTFFESSSRSIFLFEHDLSETVPHHRVVARGMFSDHASRPVEGAGAAFCSLRARRRKAIRQRQGRRRH